MSLGEKHSNLTETQLAFVENPFSIRLADRIVHLDPSSVFIETYFTETQQIVSTKIPSVNFDKPIMQNNTTYTHVLETESDYWFDILYNPYLKVYILFQHEGQSYFDENGAFSVRESNSTWGKILVLDENLNYLNSVNIAYKDEVLDIINPKFPTPYGYITIIINDNTNDSTGTHFSVSLQKIILNEI